MVRKRAKSLGQSSRNLSKVTFLSEPLLTSGGTAEGSSVSDSGKANSHEKESRLENKSQEEKRRLVKTRLNSQNLFSKNCCKAAVIFGVSSLLLSY
jgi:hypothetical protein